MEPQPAFEPLVRELTLQEACAVVTGASSWRNHPVPRLGIPALKMTDGPNGARGERTGSDATPAVVVPSGIAQGATWDPALMRRLGDLLGREAIRRGAQVLLAPSVNLHRTPIGGRTFEYLSEDPELTAGLLVPLVEGVQANGVAVAVKHFVANDTERERQSVDVRIDERTLHEMYLRPFEAAVREAGAWGVMAAYNRVDGEHCSANERLLRQILRDEWGFDGLVVSDWFGAHDAIASARAGLSLEMPGPGRVYGARLAAAVEAGAVSRAEVDELAADVLRTLDRTMPSRRLPPDAEESVDDPADRALCREAAAAGAVLLRNEAGVLPLDPDRITTLAVVGPNAAATRIQGGGSAALMPLPSHSVLDALRARFDTVLHEPGCRMDRYTPLPASAQLIGDDGEPGLELTLTNLDADGNEAVSDTAPGHRTRSTTSRVQFFGSLPAGVRPGPCRLRLTGQLVPRVSGIHHVGVIVTSSAAVTIDSTVVLEPSTELDRGTAFMGFGSAEHRVELMLEAGVPVPISVTMDLPRPFGACRLGIGEPAAGDEMERACAAAARADAAVVVVGTNDDWETEGEDRETIALPGDQDELVRRIAACNPRTVVVVNAGSPVAMPWVDEVQAILVPFFGGMELGEAVTDVVTGARDPGGRLPTTFPVRLEDSPAWAGYLPVDGVQVYAEGLLTGYRGHEAAAVEPLFPFGHGLSYGTVDWGEPQVSTTEVGVDDPTITVEVPLRGTGDRPATVVVQGYVAAAAPPVPRPPKELRSWSKLVVAPGTVGVARLTFGPQAFRRWDTDAATWVVDPGDYDLVLAASATDVRSRVRIIITDAI